MLAPAGGAGPPLPLASPFSSYPLPFMQGVLPPLLLFLANAVVVGLFLFALFEDGGDS